MTEEKKTDVEAAKQPVAAPVVATPQAIPAIVESTKPAAPIVLSQTPPTSPSDPKPAVDQASSVVASPLAEKK